MIRERSSMSVQELSQRFGVSPMTVRRDLQMLEERDIVVRIHGGAMVPEMPTVTPEQVRAGRNLAEKAAIAQAATVLVNDGQTIFIDAGTTTFELARRLNDRRGLTVITNSVRILSELATAAGINLIGIGGTVYGGAWSFVGPIAEANLRRFHCDVAFMACSSVSAHIGVTEVNFFEASTKSLAIQQSQRVVLLADHSKFDQVSPVKVADLREVNTIVTDDGLAPQVVGAYRDLGIDLIVARTND